MKDDWWREMKGDKWKREDERGVASQEGGRDGGGEIEGVKYDEGEKRKDDDEKDGLKWRE